MKLIPILILLCGLVKAQDTIQCEVPKPTQWRNLYNDCSKAQGKYRIQFFSTTGAKCSKKIEFGYYVEVDGCFNRFFVEGEYTYCECLNMLEEVKEYFPDAFIKKEFVRNLDHNTGAVACITFAATRSPVLHILQNSKGIRNDLM